MAKSRTSWQKGQSGNRKGRPAVCFELQAAAREHGPRCVAILAELAGINGPGAANEAVRLGAVRELIDRGYGRSLQSVNFQDDGAGIALHLLAARALGTELQATLGVMPATASTEPQSRPMPIDYEALARLPAPEE